MALLQINALYCQWDTKEDTGKSMTYALYICGLPTGTCQAEAVLNSDKIKLVADLRLSEGISQSVENCSNLLEEF